MKYCKVCGNENKRSINTFCSNKCQSIERYKKYINKWKIGLVSGSRGILTKNISEYVRQYLEEKHKNRCNICGWKEINPITKKVPLEIDHINGNAEDNREVNLRLICPNCHSLSSNFRNLNKGKGRSWRSAKYLKNTN